MSKILSISWQQTLLKTYEQRMGRPSTGVGFQHAVSQCFGESFANHIDAQGVSNTAQGFDQWFKNHDEGKATGYKQFQRYLDFMEPRRLSFYRSNLKVLVREDVKW